MKIGNVMVLVLDPEEAIDTSLGVLVTGSERERERVRSNSSLPAAVRFQFFLCWMPLIGLF